MVFTLVVVLLSFPRLSMGVICLSHPRVTSLFLSRTSRVTSLSLSGRSSPPVTPRALLPAGAALRYSPWRPRLPRKLFYDAGIFRDQLAGVVIVQFNFPPRPPEIGPSGWGVEGRKWRVLALAWPYTSKAPRPP